MKTEIIQSPACMPVSLSEAKAHLVVTHTLDDGIIPHYIAAATAYVEQVTRRRLVYQVSRAIYPDFPSSGGFLPLPYGWAESLTSIRYRNETGVWATLDPAEYELDVVKGRVYEAYECQWPWITPHPAGSVEVTWGHGRHHGEPWAAETEVSLNQYVRSSVWVYRASVAGETGLTAPAWPDTEGGQVVDGEVTWDAVNPVLPEDMRLSVLAILTDMYERRGTMNDFQVYKNDFVEKLLIRNRRF